MTAQTRRTALDRVPPWISAAGALVAAALLLPLAYLAFRGVELIRGPELLAVLEVGTLWLTLRSLALAAGVGALCVGLSFPLAWWTHATDLPGRRFFRIALVLPLAVPSYVAGFVVLSVFGPAGWGAATWGALGLPEIYGWPGAVLALLWAYPFALLPLQAALAGLDPAQWEAARSLGLRPSAAFRRIVLPALRPGAAVGGLLAGLYALGDFGAVSLLRFESLSYVVYLRYQSLFDRGEAVWLGLLLAALAIGILYLHRIIAGRSTPGLPARGAPRAWPVVSLGAWRWPAFALCSLVVGFGVGLPVAVVVGWLVRGLAAGNPVGPLAWETASTLGVGAVAAVLTVGLALIPALIARHGDPRLARLVHGASHVGYALPGIVVALALGFFAVRVGGVVYQSLALLLFAYVVRFLPLALGTLLDGLSSLDPRRFEAARSLGCGPGAAWRRAVLPGLMPSLQVGLLAVFLAVIKELPATLLLGPVGFGTLATRIWSLTEEAWFTAAAPPVLVLLVLATGALLLRGDVRVREVR